MSLSVQILIARKAADPTALTALDAIRTLLGYGDDLVDLFRRELFEFGLRGGEPGLVASEIEGYLEQTVSFWNPNRERAWGRISGAHPRAWEGGRGIAPRPFGEPSLDQGRFDHLLIWSRDPASPPSDLPKSIGGGQVSDMHRAELYTFAWKGEPDEHTRVRLLEGVAVAQSRGRGLLVQPHYQDHQFILGAVPITIWEQRTDGLH